MLRSSVTFAPSFVKRSGLMSKGILRSTFGCLSRSLHIATTQRQDHVLTLLQLRENQHDEDSSQRYVRAEEADAVAHSHSQECVGVFAEIYISPLRANEYGFNISIGNTWDPSHAQIVADVIGSAWKTRTWFPLSVLVVVQTQVQQRAPFQCRHWSHFERESGAV